MIFCYYRETTDSFTIAASPSFGFLGRTLSLRSSLDFRTQSGQDLNLKLPLLSDSILEKQESDKNLRKPLTSPLGESISFPAQYTGEGYISHGCSVTQTVFNGKVIFCKITIFCIFLLYFLNVS